MKKKILIQAVDKAIENGYDTALAEEFRMACEVVFKNTFDNLTFEAMEPMVTTFLFNHDFAKALWGEEEIKTGGLWSKSLETWKVRLMEMVLETDYMSYIKTNIK
jgi:hypothetical protein